MGVEIPNLTRHISTDPLLFHLSKTRLLPPGRRPSPPWSPPTQLAYTSFWSLLQNPFVSLSPISNCNQDLAQPFHFISRFPHQADSFISSRLVLPLLPQLGRFFFHRRPHFPVTRKRDAHTRPPWRNLSSPICLVATASCQFEDTNLARYLKTVADLQDSATIPRSRSASNFWGQLTQPDHHQSIRSYSLVK